MEKKIIKRNKTKLFFAFLGSVLFVAAGFYILDKPMKLIPGLENIVGSAAIVFFGALSVFAFLFLMNNKPAVIVDETGITDYSTGIGVGHIKWEDITGFSIRKVFNHRFIIVHVKNPEVYINKASGTKKWLRKRNNAMYGSPISIPENNIKDNIDELYNLFLLEWEIRNGDKIA
ncbi:STM3941 family protein [Flavobacterium alkalisoli]|uniref:STM3941 family protein n=1 Tax=Flavobacterium alkalisoli TaxID=2602769 RepID=UPI003A9398BE